MGKREWKSLSSPLLMMLLLLVVGVDAGAAVVIVVVVVAEVIPQFVFQEHNQYAYIQCTDAVWWFVCNNCHIFFSDLHTAETNIEAPKIR